MIECFDIEGSSSISLLTLLKPRKNIFQLEGIDTVNCLFPIKVSFI